MTRTVPLAATDTNTLSPKAIVERRKKRLRHIRPMTREQQIALVEEARLARTQGQTRPEPD
jgi:hypothetical protein